MRACAHIKKASHNKISPIKLYNAERLQLMTKNKGVLLVFDIDNTQSHYAECMKFIIALEKKNDLDEYATLRINAAFLSNLRFALFPQKKLGYPEAIVNWVDSCEKYLDSGDCQKRELQEFLNFVKSDVEHEFYYYFRIHNKEETDVAELFYYALMLQSFAIPQTRIISYIVPRDGDDNNYASFMRFSLFCSLLPKYLHQTLFTRRKNNVSRLENGVLSRGAFIPLIEITSDTYSSLRKERKIIAEKYTEENNPKLSDWFATIKPLNCDDRLILQLFRFTNNVIAELFGGKIRKYNKKKVVIDALVNVLNDSGISTLHYVIFGITLNEYMAQLDETTDIADWAINCMDMTNDLADGVKQVLENIVHHSDSHKGLFTIRRHDYTKANDYLNQIGYMREGFRTDEKTRNLQVLIADTNLSETIISTFIKSDKSTHELRAAEKQMSLGDFFNKYNNNATTQLWKDYRAINQTSCSGLPKFANAMEDLKALVKVRSSIMYAGENYSQSWNWDFLSSDAGFNAERSFSFIPGTQFTAIFPMSQLDNVVAKPKYEVKSVFLKTPETFADFLDYFPAKINSTFTYEFARDCVIESQDEKDTASEIAREHWDVALKRGLDVFDEEREKVMSITPKPVFIIDMHAFCSDTNIDCSSWTEPLCKGFLKSHWITKEGARYVIFINHATNFGTQFRSTATSNTHISSNKELQICFLKGFTAKTPKPNGKIKLEVLGDKDTKVPVGFPWEYFAPSDKMLRYFEGELDRHTEGLLLSKDSGYKLINTHIKLGSKVHLDSFYEIAPYFMRLEVARVIAFHLCRSLLADMDLHTKITKNNEKIVLYGYASYSRVIVNAMYEILYSYFGEEHGENLTFAIYQPKQKGLSMSSSEEVYIRHNDSISENDAVVVVQIVPISSTLTTFKKMWVMLEQKSSKKFRLPKMPSMNLSVLWVRNMPDDDISKPTVIESAYWNKVCDETKTITTDKDVVGNPRYVIFKYSNWQDPLTCQYCYPISLGLERPLIGTNASSTVPTQQYYMLNETEANGDKTDTKENYKKLNALYGSAIYGHLHRGDNHFQYFINMPKYVSKQKDIIKEWLEKLPKEGLKEELEKYSIFIVSPQRPNNVEFTQLVNNDFYGGEARMLYLDSEKHFRSNVEAEYHAYLSEVIQESATTSVGDNKSLKFVFVDTAIFTGNTFHRIGSLIDTLRRNFKDNSQDKGAMWPVFEKVFVLINRMSQASKREYVKDPISDYHAFFELQISNMRTYGDSCVGCSLEKEANKLHKLSATKQLSMYWQAKSYKNTLLSHEKWGINKPEKTLLAKSFLRMVCTHHSTQKLDSKRGKDHIDYLGALQELFDEAIKADLVIAGIRGKKSKFLNQYPNIKSAVKAERNRKVLGALVKSLSRPFLSFDYKFQDCLSDLLMFSVMLILNGFDYEKSFKALIESNDQIYDCKVLFSESQDTWRKRFSIDLQELLQVNKEVEREFLMLLIKALSEMHMNFIYRMNVIRSVISYLVNGNCNEEEFTETLRQYTRYIMRAIHNGSDDRRGIWFEYMLKCHKEYKYPNRQKAMKLILEEDAPTERGSFIDSAANGAYNKVIAEMFHTLIVENGTVLYDGIESILNECPQWESTDHLKDYLEEVHMWDFCRFLLLNRHNKVQHVVCKPGSFLNYEDFEWIKANVKLMRLFERKNSTLWDDPNGERYSTLQESLSAAVFGKRIAIIAKHVGSPKYDYIHFKNYFYVATPHPDGDSLLDFVEKHDKVVLNATGFYVGDKYIIIKLENNYTHLEKENLIQPDRAIINIQPVYICIEHNIEFPTESEQFDALLIVRNVLMFRNQLISWLEKDFNNDTIHSIARMRFLTQLLTAEKAGNHEGAEETIMLQERLLRQPMPRWPEEVLEKADVTNKIKKIYRLNYKRFGDNEEVSRWLLLYNYVNNKIGRLYRAMISDVELEGTDIEILYRTDKKPKWATLLGRKILQSFDEVIRCEIAHPIKASLPEEIGLDSDVQEVEIEGLRRERYFELLVNVVQFEVEGKMCYSKESSLSWEEKIDILAEELSQYGCKTFSIDEKNGDIYGYCAETFAVILLDFCYSTMKNNISWENVEDFDRYLFAGSAESYRFFSMHKGEECVVSIKREKGGTDGIDEYDYLVLESYPVSKPESKPGMSLPAVMWYIDGLWKWKNKGRKVMETPKVEPPSYTADRFAIRLPILERGNKR